MVVAALQSSLMFMGTVAYLMAGGEALAGALARLDAPIFAKTWQCVLLLAALQLALSQVRRAGGRGGPTRCLAGPRTGDRLALPGGSRAGRRRQRGAPTTCQAVVAAAAAGRA